MRMLHRDAVPHPTRRCSAPPAATGAAATTQAVAAGPVPAGDARRRRTGRGAGTLVALALAGVIGALPASAQVLPLPDRDRAKIDALLGAGVVGEALPSQPIADPSV